MSVAQSSEEQSVFQPGVTYTKKFLTKKLLAECFSVIGWYFGYQG